MPFFADAKVGMVQVRWGHLNREFSILTQAQSHLPRRPLHHRAHRAQPLRLLLQLQRHRGHLAARRIIEDAGGWQHDTLTEDLDLSYRAQLKGWQFIFLPEVDLPGRGAGGHERLQEPAAPLGEGLHPDREEAAADASSGATCRSR